MNPLKFKAAIFDMDGLLIDSEILWQKAEMSVFSTVGLILDHNDCRQTTGMRIDRVVEYWYEKIPWDGKSLNTVTIEIVDEVKKLILMEGKPLPGALETINLCKNLHLSLGLASSSPYDLIEVVLDTLGLSTSFAVICSAEGEKNGKPDPAVYLSTARKLNVQPEDCCALEDSVNGLKSAKNAGMFCIAVPHPAEFSRPEFDSADCKLHSLEEVTQDVFLK